MSSPTPGSRYKFTVASAAEAATVIRDQLGEEARVLSVRSVPAAGVARLWAAPQLEVIAELPAAAGPVEAEAAAPEPAPAAEPARKILLPASPPRVCDLLRRAGFSETALGRVFAREQDFAEDLPLPRALAQVGAGLRRSLERPGQAAPLNRTAFIGPAGAGRTTALCKWLGREVFRRARAGHVVVAEFDCPNPAGPLPVFCEALGVPVARYPASTQPAVLGGFVHVDLPAFSLHDHAANRPLVEFLAREKITQRVLVLNAAYDHAALRDAYAMGRSLGATHLVFTHLDEVRSWARLWDYLTDDALTPLFLATGPSLTGDCAEDIAGAVLQRTFAGLPVEERPAATPERSAA